MKLSHAAYKIYLALCDWYEQRHYPPTHDDLAGDTERSVVTRHIEKLEEIGWVKQDRTPAGRVLSRTLRPADMTVSIRRRVPMTPSPPNTENLDG